MAETAMTRAKATLQPGGLVTIFGGSGFIGRHVVQVLARKGYRVRVAVRKPNQALFVKTTGDVGQVEPVQANIRNDVSVRNALRGADAVVNLVGVLYEKGAQRFDAIQAKGAERIAKAAREEGIDVLVHVSAIGADKKSPSAYARSKAAGEEAVRTHMPQAAILRPSIVFGPEDDFFNRFASIARLAPALPLIGGGGTLFQPVYVKDVAEAIGRAVETSIADGRVFELGGPDIYTFRQLMELMLREICRKRLLIPLPVALAKPLAAILQLAPKPMLTIDQLHLLQQDNVVSEAARAEKRTFEGLDIAPVSPEAILPAYLVRFRRRGQFEPATEATTS